jgi:hypothetical protein
MKKLLLLLMIVPMIGLGQCTGDCQWGYGTYEYTDGDKYTGEWRDGEKNGLGTYIWSSGNYFKGEWFNNTRSGGGNHYYVNAAGEEIAIYSGRWKDGERDGIGLYMEQRNSWKPQWRHYNNGTLKGSGYDFYE